VADALHPDMRPSTARWLRSPEMHLLWLDALRCAEAENQVSAERLSYQQDRRSRAIHRRTVKIRDAITEATELRRRYQRGRAPPCWPLPTTTSSTSPPTTAATRTNAIPTSATPCSRPLRPLTRPDTAEQAASHDARSGSVNLTDLAHFRW
jgi:hypothetical protein